MTDKSSKITTDLYRSLKERCVQAGTNISEVCARAGVERSVPDYWKRKTPKSIETLEKLNKAIAEIEAERN